MKELAFLTVGLVLGHILGSSRRKAEELQEEIDRLKKAK